MMEVMRRTAITTSSGLLLAAGLVLVAALPSVGHGDDFAVLSPSASFTLNAGDTFNVTWNEATVNEATPIAEWQNVTLSLEQSGQHILTIGDVADRGFYAWAVPDNLSGQYELKIVRANPFETAISETFTIRDADLAITEPDIFELVWLAGENVIAAWEGDPGSLTGIDVVLVATDGSAETYTIASGIDPAAGSVTIPLTDAVPVKSYEVQLRDSSNFLSSPITRSVHDIEVHHPPGPYADGSLLREEDEEIVWVIKTLPNGKEFKRHVLTWDMAVWYPHIGNFWQSVTVVPDGTMDKYTASAWIRLPLTEDTETWKVYEVNADATKHWLTCAVADQCGSIWRGNGGDPDGIYTVNEKELNFYTTGLNVFFEQPDVSDPIEEYE